MGEAYSLPSTGEGDKPTESHLHQLRHRLLSQTKEVALPQASASESWIPNAYKQSRTSRRRWLLRSVAVSAMILVTLLLSRVLVDRADASLSQILESTRKNLWIHGKTIVTNQSKSFESQSWCSPSLRISAYQSPWMTHLIQYEDSVQLLYDNASNSIIRMHADNAYEHFGQSFVSALLTERPLPSINPDHKISSVTKRFRTVDGTRYLRYSYQVQSRSIPEAGWTTHIDVDSRSGSIVTWQETHSNGVEISTRFEYPEIGPSNLYDLGVPQDANIIDFTSGEFTALALPGQ